MYNIACSNNRKQESKHSWPSNARKSACYICLVSMWTLYMPFFDMRCTWLWVLIWDGSISGNISLTEVSKPAKFHAFIIKRTFLVVSSWTTMGWLSMIAVLLRISYVIPDGEFWADFHLSYNVVFRSSQDVEKIAVWTGFFLFQNFFSWNYSHFIKEKLL